jgi:superfamily II DNA or RNA helicase
MKMEIVVSLASKIHIPKNGLSEAVLQAIRQAWIFPNPLHTAHKRLLEAEMEEQKKAEEEGRSVRLRFAFRLSPAESLSAFEEDDTWIAVPRGCGLGRLQAVLEAHGVTMAVRDARGRGEQISVTLAPGWDPRHYQIEAVDAAVAAQRGFIEAGTGSGKTVAGLLLIARLKRVTLVVAHTTGILDGWLAEIRGDAERETVAKLAGDFRTTRIQGTATALEAAKTGDIILATVQTLYRCPQEVWDVLNRRVGLVIGDEAHHTPAATFWHVFNSLEARHRNGLTATPERKDGLGFLLHEIIGPRVYLVDEEVLVRDGAIVNPEVEFVASDFYPQVFLNVGGERVPNIQRAREIADTSYNRVELIGALVENAARNALIVSRVKADWSDGHRCAVLTERVEHAERLADALRAEGMVAEVLKGGAASLGAKKRQREIVSGMCSGRVDVIVGTSILDEGINIPPLSALHLTCPSSNEGKLKQQIGRIRRPKGKMPKVVRDYVDFRCKSVRRSYQQRRKWYRAWGWKVKALKVFGVAVR